jgi:hypothetical protein
MPAWEPFAAAAVGPALVWLLWRLQTVSVDVLRRQLLLLTRHWDQAWLYAIVSWFGTFLHEVSHATVLVLSGHGLKEFRAGVEEGHVLPSRMRGGVGMLFFLAAALAPLYIPPLLALLTLWLVLGVLPDPFHLGGDGVRGVWDALEPILLGLPKDLALAIAGLDLSTWREALVLAVVLLFAPGSRPSHVKTRFHSKGDGGDVAALRRHIRAHPLPFLLFLAAIYGAYWLTRLLPEAYWYPLEAVWAVAVAGIVLALFGALFWTLPGLDGRASPLVAWMGPGSFAAVQVAGRLLDWPVSILQLNGIAVAAWLVVALALGAVLPRR